MNNDPHPNPGRFLGRQVSFDHEGRRLSGVVTEQRFTGFTPRGNIPDYAIVVKGVSGRCLEIPSLVESYLSTK